MENELKTITKEEKLEMIGQIWKDQKGRLSNGPHALYVALDSPRPNLADLTDSVLEALSNDVIGAENWSKTWGRLVVCVRPGGRAECVLGGVNDEDNKIYVPVVTTQKLSSEQLQQMVDTAPQGGLRLVMLNNQLTTIEAFLISYLHMIDEMIWEMYRQSRLAVERKDYISIYKQVLDLVARERFLVKLSSEEEILSIKKNDPEVSVRLYGSMVNKDVPKVLGGVMPILNKGGSI